VGVLGFIGGGNNLWVGVLTSFKCNPDMEYIVLYFFLIWVFITTIFLSCYIRRKMQRQKLIKDMQLYTEFMRQQKVDQLYGRNSIYDLTHERDDADTD
jgi:hypothetical protein